MIRKKTLAEESPTIAAQWDYKKNGALTPQLVSARSSKRVFWIFPYDDPETGKYFEFQWKASIKDRVSKKGTCPYLLGRKVHPGFNDLATKCPEIAAQWDYENNGTLTPQSVTAHCRKKVFWIYPYDDPKTGKHFDFRWKALIDTRVNERGCPFLSGKRIYPGFNDLATKFPEIAAQWDYENNGSRTPQSLSGSSTLKVSWIMQYDDPETAKHFEFRWKASIRSRVYGNADCPFLSGKKVYPGFNDLATKFPEIAAQWDYENNGSLTPQSVTAFSKRKVSWVYPYDDPYTGKHFVFRWKADICNRTANKSGCPFLSGQKKVWPGFNDLATKFPEIAAQWDYENNGDLTPRSVVAFTRRKVFWVYPYDDPYTGKHFVFHWKASILSRVHNGPGCPFISGQKVYTGFNDLATRCPALAEQWDYDNNGSLTPQSVSYSSHTRVSWIYPYDDPATGKHFVFRWKDFICRRTQSGPNCPFLTGRSVWFGYNDLQTCFPYIAKDWHPSLNCISPSAVLKTAKKKYVWLCPSCGNTYYRSVYSRTQKGTSCSCSNS